MSREQHIVAVTRRQSKLFLIWFSNDQDGVLAENAHALRTFSSPEEARSFAASAAVELGDVAITEYDLDEIEAWIDAPLPGSLRPDQLLDAWNLLTDVAVSVSNRLAAERLFDRRDFSVYDRLVKSCNLPALRASDAVDPLTAADVVAIAAALRHGISCFDRAIAPSS